jgi:hypothetical protein
VFVQVVGQTCPVCEQRITAAIGATWCSRCQTAYRQEFGVQARVLIDGKARRRKTRSARRPQCVTVPEIPKDLGGSATHEERNSRMSAPDR